MYDLAFDFDVGIEASKGRELALDVVRIRARGQARDAGQPADRHKLFIALLRSRLLSTVHNLRSQPAITTCDHSLRSQPAITTCDHSS